MSTHPGHLPETTVDKNMLRQPQPLRGLPPKPGAERRPVTVQENRALYFSFPTRTLVLTLQASPPPSGPLTLRKSVPPMSPSPHPRIVPVALPLQTKINSSAQGL